MLDREKSVAAQNAATIFGAKGTKLQDIITTFKAISKDLQQKLSQSTDVQDSAIELFNIINKIDGFGDSNIADQALMENNSLVEAKNIFQSAALLINDSFINYMSYDNKEALVALLESLDLENKAQGLSQNLSDELYNQIADRAKPGLLVPNYALTEKLEQIDGTPREDDKIIINVIKRLQEINKQIVSRLEVNAYQASQDAYKQATDKIVLNQILYHVFDKVNPKYVAQSGYDVDIFEHFEKADQNVREVAKFLRNNIDTYNASKEVIINPQDFPADTDDTQSNFENDDYLDQDIPPEGFVTQAEPQDIIREPDITENRIEDQRQDQETRMDKIQDQITELLDISVQDDQPATLENRVYETDTLDENMMNPAEIVLPNYQIQEDSLNASSQNSALSPKAQYNQAELDELYNQIEANVTFDSSGKVLNLLNLALIDGVNAIRESYHVDELKLVERIKEINEQIVNRIVNLDKVDPKQREKDMKVLSSSLSHFSDSLAIESLPLFGYDAATLSKHIKLADKIDARIVEYVLSHIQAKSATELKVSAESQVASHATDVNELFKNLVEARISEREKLTWELEKFQFEEQGEISDIMGYGDEVQQGNGNDSDCEPIKKIGAVIF
jgi:hypothetical protein